MTGELKKGYKLQRSFQLNLPVLGEIFPYATLRFVTALFIRIERGEEKEQPNKIPSQLTEVDQGRKTFSRSKAATSHRLLEHTNSHLQGLIDRPTYTRHDLEVWTISNNAATATA